MKHNREDMEFYSDKERERLLKSTNNHARIGMLDIWMEAEGHVRAMRRKRGYPVSDTKRLIKL